MTKDPWWNLLRAGDTEKGLRLLQKYDAEDQSASSAMELGVAYLWFGRFRAAWEHFHEFNETYPLHVSSTYGMAGVAKWCMKEPDEAVEIWQTGLGCKFADGGVSIELPLLLFFASVVKPNVFSRSEAEDILVKQLNDPLSEQWPGPLAKFVLGRIDENRLRRECISTLQNDRKDDDTAMNHWQANFYAGAVELSCGKQGRFREMMNRIAAVTWTDYDLKKDLFLSKLWSEELFLARHVLSVEK